MSFVIRLAHVSLCVSDTQRALGFYQGILGLAVNAGRPAMDFPGAWLDVGDGRQIHLLELPAAGNRDLPATPGGREPHVALEVDDIEKVKLALDVAGVEYAASRSGRRALFCRDPDGNAVELVEV